MSQSSTIHTCLQTLGRHVECRRSDRLKKETNKKRRENFLNDFLGFQKIQESLNQIGRYEKKSEG